MTLAMQRPGRAQAVQTEVNGEPVQFLARPGQTCSMPCATNLD